jgi:ActR/RegA family two-component response regulator
MVRFETELITRELVRARGNVSRTARALGLHRQSLQHKLKELSLDAARFREEAGAAAGDE